VIRWILPVWLTFTQAETYSSLPPYILRGLLAHKFLPRAGPKIYRHSIDAVLLEAALTKQPIFWGTKH
jgi:hypothetical protein